MEYCKWATDNNFESMLPKDAKWRHDAALTSTISKQALLDGHLVPKEQVVRYTEVSFRTAAIKWIIETDQVSPPKLYNSLLIMQYYSHSKRSSIRPSKT